MPLISVLAIAIGLGADAMSVCVAVGVRWHGGRQKFRLAWHMGLFQFLMPVIGSLIGKQFAELLREVAPYLAAAMVVAVGAKMLLEAIRRRPAVADQSPGIPGRALLGKDPTRGWSLVALSLATSIDALVVGFSLGLKGRQVYVPSLIIGVVAGLMALTGVMIGQRVGKAIGYRAELIGAFVLIAVGISFIWI